MVFFSHILNQTASIRSIGLRRGVSGTPTELDIRSAPSTTIRPWHCLQKKYFIMALSDPYSFPSLTRQTTETGNNRCELPKRHQLILPHLGLHLSSSTSSSWFLLLCSGVASFASFIAGSFLWWGEYIFICLFIFSVSSAFLFPLSYTEPGSGSSLL